MQRLRLIALVVFPLIAGHIIFPASLVLQVWRLSHIARFGWLPMVYLAAAIAPRWIGAGPVVPAVDEFSDLPPPRRDPAHPAGNHVAIESSGVTIYLAHLRRDSVAVRAGDRVRAGETVGRVGNSGNTTEPHLHIHAEKGPCPGRFSGQPALPLTFGGRFLVRNDQVV
jgi:hypothetical protein